MRFGKDGLRVAARAGVWRVGARALAAAETFVSAVVGAVALTFAASGSASAAPAVATGAVTTAIAATATPTATTATCGAAEWPRWQQFKRDFISADGRVIDVGSADERTVSEGQSYALFFALVANDRAAFDTILQWTEQHLARGDLTAHLPAWLWGRDADNRFAVLDSNASSDADLWIAYALLEAGHAWHERSYTARGAVLARRVLDEETASMPGLGLTLLPGPAGFHPDVDLWRVNPSYTPPQVLRGLATRLPDDARWPRLLASASRVLVDTAPRGFAPDWALYRAHRGFAPDPQTHAESAYNAIRVYLWAGMLDRRDPLAATLLAHYAPFASFIAAHGAPPEKVDTSNGEAGANMGNAGFSAAAVPLLDARGQRALADAQLARAAQLDRDGAAGYYTSVLSLFALGWREGRYRFAVDGTLAAQWSTPCRVALQ
ncbi:cellulase [Paraburkholderia sp. MMS20-SJTR3]|uniref:cellulase n=1 Tax=Paraburkholderia sejongensis TaxID=2886946 RepID=A0ABS8JMB7_9BURK|nr:cellulose synthase complex periplasmic endoglucanase BcsZ [Paraburkholderia sp. MMS20-SJTR3]MCC8391026.1 cellulase [Paraburkholderia sp. MMS20-SJTR3]